MSTLARKRHCEKVDKLVKHHLGHKDTNVSYIYRCPECPSPTYIMEKLSRHLELKRGKHCKEAQLQQSRMRIMFLWCRGNNHSRNFPLPCEGCAFWLSRLDNHLKTHTVHTKINPMSCDERNDVVNSMRKKYWLTSNKDFNEDRQLDTDVHFIRRSTRMGVG